MKLPAKIEYAGRAVLELSLKYNVEAPTQISTIAKLQQIPQNFLPQLLVRLKNAGIVNSARGVSGGYYLAKDPSHISLADVVMAIDASILEAPKKLKIRKSSDSSEGIRQIWEDINQEIFARLSLVTFNLLAAQARSEQITYHI